MVDYSKWDALKYSSSEEDDDDDDDEKGEKEALGSAKMYAALANLSLSSSSSSSFFFFFKDLDRVGDASQRCVRLACDSEIERDRSVVLFKGEQRESGCA